jgi:hypothetical protein
MQSVRTTVTIDADTEALIREEASRTGASFKAVLNQAVRRALGPRGEKQVVEPLFTVPFPVALTDINFNRLAAEWEDQDTLRELTS